MVGQLGGTEAVGRRASGDSRRAWFHGCRAAASYTEDVGGAALLSLRMPIKYAKSLHMPTGPSKQYRYAT